MEGNKIKSLAKSQYDTLLPPAKVDVTLAGVFYGLRSRQSGLSNAEQKHIIYDQHRSRNPSKPLVTDHPWPLTNKSFCAVVID